MCSKWYRSQFNKFEKAWARVEILCLNFLENSIKKKYNIDQSSNLRNLWDFYYFSYVRDEKATLAAVIIAYEYILLSNLIYKYIYYI